MCALVLRETGLLPHANPGVMSGEEIAALRKVTVSQGIMLESASPRLRGLLSRCRTGEEYRHSIEELLGTFWDAELEPYRLGGDGAPVTLLHQVG